MAVNLRIAAFTWRYRLISLAKWRVLPIIPMAIGINRRRRFRQRNGNHFFEILISTTQGIIRKGRKAGTYLFV